MDELGLIAIQDKMETRDRLMAFIKTDAYQEFIVDGFQNDEVVRCSQALIEDAMQDDVDQRLLKQKMSAGAHLGQYLLTIRQMGNGAEMQLQEHTAKELEAQNAEEQETEVDPITGEEYVVGGK